MNFVFIYFDNPQMLARQIACWNTYATLSCAPPKIILVDDGSPNHPALDVIHRYELDHRLDVDVDLYRIEEDIRWNFAGARNLGCHHATGWIHVSDIDTLIYAADAATLTEAAVDEKCFYLPRRCILPAERLMHPTVVNLTFHKTLYEAVGGYDEDYAGHYGREHTDFHVRLKRIGRQVDLAGVHVRLMPPWMICDAKTVTGDRNDVRNTKLFCEKRAAGYPRPAPGLRFKWIWQR